MIIDIFLDSGAYSAFTQKKPIQIDDYIAFIRENEESITQYASLDVINDGPASYKNYMYMKNKGLNPIPVYHAETDVRYLKRYLKYSDYIAIGAISKMSTKARVENLDHIWNDYLTDDEGFPLVKTHGFGLTTTMLMFRYPWFSVDSSTWLMTSRRGIIILPRFKNDEPQFFAVPRRIEISTKSSYLSDADAHFTTLTGIEQRKIREYARSLGFEIGESLWEEDEEQIIVEGLCNSYKLRDRFNMHYFIGLEKSIPDYPWKFNKRPGLFT